MAWTREQQNKTDKTGLGYQRGQTKEQHWVFGKELHWVFGKEWCFPHLRDGRKELRLAEQIGREKKRGVHTLGKDPLGTLHSLPIAFLHSMGLGLVVMRAGTRVVLQIERTVSVQKVRLMEHWLVGQ